MFTPLHKLRSLCSVVGSSFQKQNWLYSCRAATILLCFRFMLVALLWEREDDPKITCYIVYSWHSSKFYWTVNKLPWQNVSGNTWGRLFGAAVSVGMGVCIDMYGHVGTRECYRECCVSLRICRVFSASKTHTHVISFEAWLLNHSRLPLSPSSPSTVCPPMVLSFQA